MLCLVDKHTYKHGSVVAVAAAAAAGVHFLSISLFLFTLQCKTFVQNDIEVAL